MKNPFVRWVAIILGTLAVLTCIAAGVLFFLMSRFDARTEIAKAVRDVTGRELTIAGPVGVSLFPVLGLTAQKGSLANVEGGRAPALASMEAISVGVELWPLLRQEIDVRSLVLDKPVIALETDAEGKPNWILTPRTRPPTTGPGRQTPPFSLAEIIVNDGEVSFYDGKSKTGWVVSDADLRTALLSLDEPLRVTGDATYKEANIELDLTIGEPRKAFAGQATSINVALDSDLLEARFTGQTTATSAQLNGDIRAHGRSLKELAAWAGAPITGIAGLGDFAVQGTLTISGGQLAFGNASIVVDRLRGRGDFTLLQRAGKPYVSGRLELFDFDVNPYLTGETAALEDEGDPEAALAAIESGAEPAMADSAAAPAAPRALDVEVAPSETPIDFSGLKAFNADLELTTGALRVQAMSIDSSQVTLVINDGFLAATMHRLDLYGGTGRGRLMVDAREPVVKIDEDLTISGANARAFLTDAANLDTLEGEAEITLGFRTQGRTQSEFIAGLDGRGHIEVTGGALRGVDLGGVSRTIRNAMRGELVGANKRTPFTGFSATFSAANGVLATDSLSFNTADLRITGLGLIDLVQRRIDMRLAPRAQRGGLVFPFTVRGPFTSEFEYNSDITGRALNDLRPRVEAVKQGSRER